MYLFYKFCKNLKLFSLLIDELEVVCQRQPKFYVSKLDEIKELVAFSLLTIS